MIDLPRVAIGTRYLRGADVWPDPSATELDITTFEDAFTAEWPFDAHFVTYDVPGLDRFPRLKKSGNSLANLRADGYDVVATMFALDYDNPDHSAWTPEMLEEFQDNVSRAAKLDDMLDGWRAHYTTKHGARFVYVLREGVPVGKESESMHKSLVRAWGQRGIALDPACSDWTRLFRLPKVVRE